MILFLGDIHGNFEKLKSQITRIDLTDCTIIQVGDFGAGYSSTTKELETLQGLNDFLANRNIMVYAIRGNHDNPSFFNGSWKFSNLELIPDYSVLTLDGHKILCIGGAISIDRKRSLERDLVSYMQGNLTQSYWKDEVVRFDEDFLNNIRDIDIVVTHTAPDFCFPNNKTQGFGDTVQRFAMKDPNLIYELVNERHIMTRIFDILKRSNRIQKHFYGHFHDSSVEQFDGVTHRLLNINELYELR